MAVTRSSSKGNSAHTTPSSSPQTTKSTAAGTKRKAESTPTKAKRGKTEKTQKTIEETIDNDEQVKGTDVSMKDAGEHKNDEATSANAEIKASERKQASWNDDKEDASETKPTESEAAEDADTRKAKPQTTEGDDAATEEEEMTKAAEKVEKDHKEQAENTNDAEDREDSKEASSNSAVKTDEKRKQAEPSNILEKGLIYFFFRGRVNIHDPSSVSDIQRSYILLRPLPSGASLGDGPVPSGGKARIIALPKKTLPASHNDRFLCFVEAANSSFDDIKKQHLDRAEYTTKTSGNRETPAAQPAAEGIYAITATGRESHLAYILTVPDEIGEVQKELGLATRGAFITSVRNPETDAPTGTVPDQRAEYSKEIMDDFRGLRWGRLEPRHLDYKDTHFLLIGEHEVDKLEKSVKASDGDGTKEGKEEPKEEMELLEKEDEERIKRLSGDDSDAIFKDLGLSKEEFSKIKTTW